MALTREQLLTNALQSLLRETEFNPSGHLPTKEGLALTVAPRRSEREMRLLRAPTSHAIASP